MSSTTAADFFCRFNCVVDVVGDLRTVDPRDRFGTELGHVGRSLHYSRRIVETGPR